MICKTTIQRAAVAAGLATALVMSTSAVSFAAGESNAARVGDPSTYKSLKSEAAKQKAAALAVAIENAIHGLGEGASAQAEQGAIDGVINSAGDDPAVVEAALSGVTAFGGDRGNALVALNTVHATVVASFSSPASAGVAVSGLNGSAALANAPASTSGGGSDYAPGA